MYIDSVAVVDPFILS